MTRSRTRTSAQRTLIACIAALVFASVAFRVLIAGNFEHTSLTFIGIPAILAIALTTLQPRTSVGTVNKTIAIALCLSGILFGEGFVCILMASPLFFLVGTVIGKTPGGAKRDSDASTSTTWRNYGILLLTPLALEGVVPGVEFGREEVVHVTRVVAASMHDVERELGSPMRFDRPLPTFFRLGFPTPGRVSGEGLAVGDVRSVEFLHGEHHPGALVLQIAERGATHVRFVPVSDHTYITHWLSWRSAEVAWRETPSGQTEVTWTLSYRRRLDPAFYFAPLERYGVRLAADYLIATLATPGAR
jgi:hypothetical protein